MSQMKMEFVVDEVLASRQLASNSVRCVQADPGWVNPMFRNCQLILNPVSSDELKKFGPGATVSVEIEYPG